MKNYESSCSERTEVLDKVKALFLIPGMEVMTTKQVADYFEVDHALIKKVYERNKEEIDSDNTMIKKPEDFSSDILSPLKGTKRGVSSFQMNDGSVLEVQNFGVRCFSRRAILRIAMLLRDSEIA